MKAEPAHFSSDGIQLEGRWFWPESMGEGAPVIVACSGFMGLRAIHPERFARSLTAVGYPCFGFDYRGFAPSAGVPRRVFLDEQIRDIQAAVTFAGAHDRLRNRRIVLLGWGMAGGLILEAAGLLPRLAGLIAVNGFYNGRRVQKAVRGDDDYQRFLQWVDQERLARARSSEPRYTDPFDIYPLDPVTKEYVDSVLRKQEGFGGEVDTGLADSLLSFAPETRLDRLGDTPLLIAHGSHNALHPPDEARSLSGCYPGPVEQYWVEGGHTEWMHDDHPRYVALAERIVRWLDDL